MDASGGELTVQTDDDLAILRFLDLEGLVELIETAELRFRRWEGGGGGDDPTTFLHHWLPEALMRFAAAERKQPRGKLQRWWAAKERDQELDAILERIRAFRMPEVAWIDDWHEAAGDEAVLWRVQEASGQPIALRSTVGAVKAALAPAAGENLLVGAVVYGERSRHGQPAAPFHPALRGEPRLAFERQVRAVVTVADRTRLMPELPLAVDLGQLIAGVTLAPTVPSRRLELVRRLLARAGLDVPCAAAGAEARDLPRLPAVVASR